MPEPISQADYAKHRGCSRVAVHKAIKTGRIALTDNGRIDAQAADAAWLQNSRARIASSPKRPASAPQPDDSPADYQESRARRESAEAGLSELELGRMSGELLARGRVELAVFHASRALRDQLTTCAGSLGAAVSSLSSAFECEAAIRTAHRKLLEDFMHSLGKMLGEPPAGPALAAEAATAD